MKSYKNYKKKHINLSEKISLLGNISNSTKKNVSEPNHTQKKVRSHNELSDMNQLQTNRQKHSYSVLKVRYFHTEQKKQRKTKEESY